MVKMTRLLNDLHRVQEKEIPKAAAVLRDAFRHDPVWNRVFEGAEHKDEKLLAFHETPLRFCSKYGEVYASSDKIEGVAAWVPGTFSYMSFWRMLRSGAMRAGMKMGSEYSKKLGVVLRPIEKDRKANMKGRDFLYLQVIGVAGEFQGKGFGKLVLQALIEKSEEEKIPIYLETETENNVRWYERFGFSVIKKIILPEIDLPMWEMIREPE
jgi:ribosomal protein S18 acetylase RimI-like enzyme